MESRKLALSYQYRVGDLTQRREIQKLLAATKGEPEERALKIGLLKSLKRARYLTKPLGHYGLSKSNYLHFTSPIRRYADLVAPLAGPAKRQTSAPCRSRPTRFLAEHICATERTAAEAEIEAVRMKKLEFFEQQLAERNPQVFRASVVDVRNFGLIIELPDALLSGVIHVSSPNGRFLRL